MEQAAKPCSSPQRAELLQGQAVTCNEPCSFSRRFLCRVLQLGFVRSLLKVLQKASAWVGFVLPVETIISRVCPVQSRPRPTRLARKRRGRLTRLLLAFIPTRIQNALGHLPADWGQSSVPREVREALINPSCKANKRKRDDVALEEQESWVVVLEKDLPEDDPNDVTYEPSEVETDTEEYRSQNDTETDLEFEEQEGTTVLKESSDLQVKDAQPTGDGDTPEPLAMSSEQELKDPAASSSAEDAPDADSGDGATQKPQADVSSGDSSEQGADADYESSSSSHYGDKQEA